MPRYRILWHERQYHESYVEAESESAARQCWIDDDFDSDDLLDGERDAEAGIDEITEEEP